MTGAEVQGHTHPVYGNAVYRRPAYKLRYPCILFDEGIEFIIEFEGATPKPRRGSSHPDGKEIQIPVFHSPDFEFNPEPISMAEHMKPQNEYTAAVALAYYNKKHHTDYELVDALDSVSHFIYCVWYHINFTAKPRTPNNGESESSSSAKLFFAEYNHVRGSPVFHCCRILEEGAKTQMGCLLCGDRIRHPTRGFQQGLYPRATRTLRPRSARPVSLPKPVASSSKKLKLSLDSRANKQAL